MRPVVTAAQVREAEEAFFAAHPGVDLMSRAASAVAAEAADLLGSPEGRRVLVLVGPGNNGGDGLYAGASLAAGGARVSLWFSSSRHHESGGEAATAAGCRAVGDSEVLDAAAESDLVIDAVLGIGGRPGLRPAVAGIAEALDALGVPVVAVDLPSGLDADSHEVPASCVRATRTVTFIGLKTCHVARPAADRCGQVRLVDIGVECPATRVHAAEPADLARLWPVPTSASDKYSRGVVGLDVGSEQYPGAAVLATTGAVYAGAGMVRFGGPQRAASLIRSRLPSVVHAPGRVQAWVCGSGWGPDPDGRRRLGARAAVGVPLVVDADAIALVAAGEAVPAGSLLTPHAGELARAVGVDRADVVADPVGHARGLAARTGCTVLLKGATQYAVTPEGDVSIAVPGPAWTAQAGSGDVLAGVCGTLLAAGLTASDAAVLGASVQARCAADNPGPWPPDDLARRLPATIAALVAPTEH